MDLYEPTEAREVRGYYIFAGPRCVMDIEGRPGHLISVASHPGPAKLPEHPWLHAISRGPEHEHALRMLLAESADFEDFLGRLVAAGYDLVANDVELFDLEGGPRRILKNGKVVGVAWQGRGTFSTLTWQPELGEQVHEHAVLTVYDPDAGIALYKALKGSTTFNGFVAELGQRGFTLA